MSGTGNALEAAKRKATEGRAIAALHASPYFSVRRIHCRCDGDVIVLMGRVPSFYYKQLAQETIAHLEGMPRVLNQIGVTGS